MHAHTHANTFYIWLSYFSTSYSWEKRLLYIEQGFFPSPLRAPECHVQLWYFCYMNRLRTNKNSTHTCLFILNASTIYGPLYSRGEHQQSKKILMWACEITWGKPASQNDFFLGVTLETGQLNLVSNFLQRRIDGPGKKERKKKSETLKKTKPLCVIKPLLKRNFSSYGWSANIRDQFLWWCQVVGASLSALGLFWLPAAEENEREEKLGLHEVRPQVQYLEKKSLS